MKSSSALVVFVTQKVGMRDGVKVLTFVAQWGIVARKLRREPTWPEFCAYWKESRATYFRSMKLHRRVWPEDKTPQRVWNWVESQVPHSQSVDDLASAMALVRAS
jgi:hypothetical protein